jgi:magnesium transporter
MNTFDFDETHARVRQVIHQKKFGELRDILSKLHEPELVELISHLSGTDASIAFRLLSRAEASKVFRRLDQHNEEKILKHISHKETVALLDSLKPDERVHLIEEMPAKATRRLLNMLQPEDRAEAVQLLGYPEESVGRLMTPDFIAVKADWSVSRSMEHIRERAPKSEAVHTIYVVAEKWRLVGKIQLHDLVFADPVKSISSIMDSKVMSISAYDDREHAVTVMNDYNITTIPVVDSGSALLGIVTFDDLSEVSELETTEDFHKMSAISPLDMSYKHASVLGLFRRRVGWLIALVVINLISSGVIAAYEETIATAVALVFFIPLLIASGGNAGAQSATLMIRALSTGDVKMKQWTHTILKEMAVGISLAVTLGFSASIIGIIQGGWTIGLVVGLSMALIVIVTNLLGSLLPFVLLKFRVDPAVASGPLVTSVADVLGLFIYFTVATAILGSVVS